MRILGLTNPLKVQRKSSNSANTLVQLPLDLPTPATPSTTPIRLHRVGVAIETVLPQSPKSDESILSEDTSDMDLSLDPSNESLDSGSSGLKKARPKKPETEEEFASFFPFSLDFSHTTALPENPGISSYKSIEYYSPTQNSMTARILLASITVSMLIALLTRRRGYLYRRFRGSTKPSLPSIGTKV